MKVNITYSIELDDIPSEIVKRISEVRSELYLVEEDIEDIKKSLEAGNVSSTLQKISQWRELLASLDQKMAEYGMMLAEYQKAIADLYLAKEEAIQMSKAPQKNQQLEADIAESQPSDEEEEINYDMIQKNLIGKEEEND